MPDFIGSANADANGNATFVLLTIPSGKEWVFQQIAVSTIPPILGAGCIATLYRNNQVISQTNQGGGGSAGGQPYYRFTSADQFKVVWSGAGAKAQCNVTVSYTEHIVGTATPMNTGIV